MVTVITVNYNSTNKLNHLLKSLKKIKTIVSEVIIIDNNSKDIGTFTVPKFKHKLIINGLNTGFSRAVNQGIRMSKTDIVLLLNPDSCLIDSSPIKTYNLIRKNVDIAVTGGQIINNKRFKKNNFTATQKPTVLTMLFEFTLLKRIFKNNIFSKGFWIETNHKTKREVDVFSVCGAYLFLKKSSFKHKQQIFDEDYFLYLEDLDLGYEVEKNKKRVVFDPNSKVRHIGGYSSKSRLNIVYSEWLASRTKFTEKHFNGLSIFILKIVYKIEQFFLLNYHYITHTTHD